MKTLESLAKNDPRWSLDEFVEVVNQLLPQFLPVQKSHTRVREEITPRLVRHYTTQGINTGGIYDGTYVEQLTEITAQVAIALF